MLWYAITVESRVSINKVLISNFDSLDCDYSKCEILKKYIILDKYVLVNKDKCMTSM